MKKSIVVLLISILFVSMTACGDTARESECISGTTESAVSSDSAADVEDENGQASDNDDQSISDNTAELNEDEDDAEDSEGVEENQEEEEMPVYDSIDVDLTTLSSTMVYSEVYNMMCIPEDYVGTTVKMTGSYVATEDASTGCVYHACIIKDATACCSQGIEFEWFGEHEYPAEYPQQGNMITVTGVFNTYMENGCMYAQLSDAVIECE